MVYLKQFCSLYYLNSIAESGFAAILYMSAMLQSFYDIKTKRKSKNCNDEPLGLDLHHHRSFLEDQEDRENPWDPADDKTRTVNVSTMLWCIFVSIYF